MSRRSKSGEESRRPVDPQFVRRVPLVRRLLVGLTAVSLLDSLLLVVQVTTLSSLIAALFDGRLTWSSGRVDLIVLALAATSRAAVGGAREWLGRRGSAAIRADVRSKALRALTTIGPERLSRRSAGDLATEIGPGIDRADGYLSRSIPALVTASVVPPLLIARLAWADWQSAAVVLVLLPLVPLFMVLIGVTTRRSTQRQHEQLNRLAGRFLDLVQGLTTLRIYGRANDQKRAVEVNSDRYRRSTLDALKTALMSGLVLDLLTTLSIAVVAVDIGLRVDHSRVSLGVALLVLFLLPEIFAPIRNVGAQYHANLDGQTALGAALALIREADSIAATRPDDRGVAPHHRGPITLQHVVVQHDGRSAPSLSIDELTFAPGEIVAVTGRSGAGKTTLLSVLLGFTSPTSGELVVGTAAGSHHVTTLDVDVWREGVAWVPQHPRPSQSSVAGEVRLGDPDATEAQVDRALAECHALPAATPLEEDGRNTSAGQRRRIALARALLRARRAARYGQTPLVLLDEPSEDLDQATEQVVCDVISSLAGWATVVIVTHSRTLVTLADRELTLASGHVVGDVRLRPERTSNPSMLSGDSSLVTVSDAGHRAEDLLLSAGAWSWRELARPARRGLIAAIGFACVAGLAGLALMATSNWLILRAAQHPNVQALGVAVVGVRLFALSRPLARYAERMKGHDAALRLMASMRTRVFDALVPLVPLRGANLRRGELLRSFVSDVDGVQDAVVRLVVPLAGAVATALGAFVVAAVIDPGAGVALGSGLALAFAVAMLSSRGADITAGNAVAAAAGRRDRQVTALVESLPELTAYGATGASLASLADAEESVRATARREALSAALGTSATGTVTALTLTGTVWVAAHDGVSGPVVGALIACVLVGAEGIAAVPSAVAAYGRLRGQLERVLRLLAAAPTRVEPSAPVPLPSGALGLVGTDVALAPQPFAPDVLTGASLDVRPGERTVIVGPSGSGKSTLLTSVLGLLRVHHGSLDVTGDAAAVSLEDVSESDLRPRIAGSLQGDHVFDVSLRDNLRFVRPDVTEAELDAVARRAGLADFVDSLPNGWDTRAGADGAALSGGQRQRLLLARALLADPDILVLDEPTAHLDEDTERAVLADLVAATCGRTVVMTSHRPAALDGADHVARVADRTIRQS